MLLAIAVTVLLKRYGTQAPYSDFVILRIRYTYLLSRRRFRWVQWPRSLGYSMELSRNDTRVFLDLGPPKRPVQRRRRMDSSRSACLPHVLLNCRAGVYGLMGIQAVEGSCDDQGGGE